jgi:hypothetical protein
VTPYLFESTPGHRTWLDLSHVLAMTEPQWTGALITFKVTLAFRDAPLTLVLLRAELDDCEDSDLLAKVRRERFQPLLEAWTKHLRQPQLRVGGEPNA